MRNALDDHATSVAAEKRKAADKNARGSKSVVAPFEATASSMYDLMFERFEEPRWIVDDYLPEGAILIAGSPKSGKSWFVLNVMLSAILEIRFLKKPAVRCGGLYLSLDDPSPRRMQSRVSLLMKPYGDQMEALKNFEYRCDWPAGLEGAVALDEYLTAHPSVKIVAIDVLKNIRPRGADRSRSAYELDYEALEPWKQIANERRITLLIVHHTRKAESDDAFDSISGTLGINGAVDQLVVLKRRVGSEKSQATIHMRGRDLREDVELGIELKGGWWELVGTAGQISANDARKLVIDVTRDAGEPMTCSEILKATGKKSRGSMDKLLNKMVEDGLLAKQGHRYRLISL